MRAFALLALLLAASCEYHDQANTIVFEKTCYELDSTAVLTAQVQAQDAAGQPVDNLSVHWTLSTTALRVEQEVTKTSAQHVGSFAGAGIATAKISVVAQTQTPPPADAELIASASGGEDVIMATAEIRVLRTAQDVGCPKQSSPDGGVGGADAGLDARSIDGGSTDGGTDAAMP